MATLPQRFKLLATRCAAAAPSPSRSPAPSYGGAASPGYRLRRCRTRRRGRLRRLLGRGGGGAEAARQEDDKKPLVGRAGAGRTLRDLFVASPEAVPPRDGDGGADGELCPRGGGGRRFGAGGLRSLLMRRSWRPVLVAIPEGDGKLDLAVIEDCSVLLVNLEYTTENGSGAKYDVDTNNDLR